MVRPWFFTVVSTLCGATDAQADARTDCAKGGKEALAACTEAKSN